MREALFDILAHNAYGPGGMPLPRGARVVDAFAGSGALGFEALSRGAVHVTFIEDDAAAADFLRRNAASLGEEYSVDVLARDATRPGPTTAPPVHAKFRNVASSWFTPRAVGRRRPEVERITRDLLDTMATKSEADFVLDFAAPLTLSVLADMLGVPRDDWERMFEWTNRVAGSADPELPDG